MVGKAVRRRSYDLGGEIDATFAVVLDDDLFHGLADSRIEGAVALGEVWTGQREGDCVDDAAEYDLDAPVVCSDDGELEAREVEKGCDVEASSSWA